MPKPSWDPPPELTAAERQAGADAVYDAIMHALHAYSREDETLPTMVAVFALTAVAGSMAAASGIVWSTPGIAAALRKLADELDERCRTGPPPPTELKTLRAFFEAARPPVVQ